ncbi:hypothetical protein BOX15_Mlig014109g2, partial [Macrostomum lignano]
KKMRTPAFCRECLQFRHLLFNSRQSRRCLLSLGDKHWPQSELTQKTRLSIESAWSDRLAALDAAVVARQNSNDSSDNKEKFYILCMFPYPSGRLHMGHLRVYTLGDVVTRYQRFIVGRQVLHPMGWDAFGLPAENAARDRGLPAEAWTRDNIDAMRQQLKDMRLAFDWSREFATCDPEYYRWTQWLFIKLHKSGLCYRRKAYVNWDPVDQTVLADEQVDADGRSWRSGALVEQRPLTQWFVRVSAYYESLLAGLNTVRSDQWREVAKMQRGWLGKLDGTWVQFVLLGLDGKPLDEDLQVFTRQPASLRAVSHLEVSQSSCLIARFPELVSDANSTSSDILLPVLAVNPVTMATVSVVYRPSLTFPLEEAAECRAVAPEFDVGAAASPADNIVDRLGISRPSPTLTSAGLFRADVGGGLAGLPADSDEAFDAALIELRRLGAGGHRCSALRRDWLVSRQRRWGTPIPVLHCGQCGPVTVPEEDLPVRLDAEPIAPCPKCGQLAERDRETLDTFVDSSWYYLRFLDARNDKKLCGADKAQKMMPVDLYIGGMEHAVRHLYYARFISHFLHRIGVTPQPEPFDQFLPVGLVLGRTCQLADGRYVPPDEVDFDKSIHLPTGRAVTVTQDKMSKSKLNGVEPGDVLRRLSIDTTRLCLLASTAPQSDRVWDEAGILSGVVNWQKRLWRLVTDLHAVGAEQQRLDPTVDNPDNADVARLVSDRRKTVAAALRAYESTYAFSVAIARMQSLTSLLLSASPEQRRASPLWLESMCLLVYLLSPMAPMFSSELWLGLSAQLGSSADTKKLFDGKFRFDRGVVEQLPDEALAFARLVAESDSRKAASEKRRGLNG